MEKKLTWFYKRVFIHKLSLVPQVYRTWHESRFCCFHGLTVVHATLKVFRAVHAARETGIQGQATQKREGKLERLGQFLRMKCLNPVWLISSWTIKFCDNAF